MNWRETLGTSWSAVRSHTLRSLLTVLGILIGIAAVILTVGLGLGTQKDVSAQISSLGSNLLIVSPGSSTDASGFRGGFGTSTTLTRADSEALTTDAAPDIAGVAAETGADAEVERQVLDQGAQRLAIGAHDDLGRLQCGGHLRDELRGVEHRRDP